MQAKLIKFLLLNFVTNSKLLSLLLNTIANVIEAKQNVHIFHPNLLHITYQSQELNRVIEEIKKVTSCEYEKPF